MARIYPNCPACGAVAHATHDRVDGMDFGWSGGCTACCNQDGIHGMDIGTPKEQSFSCHCYPNKQMVLDWWKKRVERYKEIGK